MPHPRNLLMIVLALLMIQGMMTPTVVAQEGPGGGGMARILFEVGLFTYQAQFTFADGTPMFTLRSSYRANFLYQHHNPVVRHHYLSVSFGFYFEKTMIGRSMVQSLEFDKVAFYSKWQNSAGYSFDLLGDIPLVEINGSIEDGKIVNGMILIDDEAANQLLPMFGGTYVFTNLTVLLDGGEIVNFGENDIQISVEQYGSEIKPRDAIVSGGNDLESETDSGIVLINTQASAPIIFLIDMIFGVFILGTSGVIVILTILHLKGKIILPLDRFKGVLIRQVQDTGQNKVG
ncbi:MAG: hypothetical protein ACTSQZ_01920 [Candidatus Thorarchaeota archaeon]